MEKFRPRFALVLAGAASMAAVWGASTLLGPHNSGQIGEALVVFGALCILAATAWRAARAEATVERLEQSLLDEHSYQVFIDSAIEGFFRTTREGRYLKVNPALAHIYGYDSPEQLTNELTDIAKDLYTEPDRREAFGELMAREGKVHDFISKIRRRDGTVIWIAENARIVRDDEGQFLFYEGTVEDITEQRLSEDAMRAALEESREAARAKAAFLAAMSHELKTPLNAVIGFSELILQELFGPIGEPRYRGYIVDIHDNGRRLLAQINDILDLSRIEGRLIELEEDAVALKNIVSDACESAVLGKKEAPPIAIDIAAELPLLRADERRMRQIIGHLVSNAVKFTPAKGVVTVSAERASDGGLTISITDTGIGMAPERTALALEPFKQLDSRLSRRFEGVGLGLPLANALVQLHGGKLTIKSALGLGTTVIVSLPADRILELPVARTA